MKRQRKVCGFDENDINTYSCGPGLRSYLKKETRPKCLTMPEKSSKEINILDYGLAFVFTYSVFRVFLLAMFFTACVINFAIVLQ